MERVKAKCEPRVRSLYSLDITELNAKLQRLEDNAAAYKKEHKERVEREAIKLANKVLESLKEMLSQRLSRVTWVYVEDLADWNIVMKARRHIIDQGLECTFKIHARSFRIRIPTNPC